MTVLSEKKGRHFREEKTNTVGLFDLMCGIILLWLSVAFAYNKLENSKILMSIAFLLTAMLFATWLSNKHKRNFLEVCMRFRWIIATIVFIICVSLRIHGSSIGIYDEILPTQVDRAETTLFGEPRALRVDEYAVQTPTFFSQYYNDFNLYSTQKSIMPINMLLDYYSPVHDLSMIGKPLAWGYLLFGNEIGLSWYWCSLEILLFMTSLEMFLVLLEGREIESLVGAALIGLSPEIQWWILPHMPIVVMYAMALFSIGYHFFTAKRELYRFMLGLLAVIGIIGFSISIFPSFQVPYTYIIIILLISCLIRDRKKITLNKNGIYILIFAILASIIILGRFIYISKDDILMLLHTKYPGDRVSVGGVFPVKDLFMDITSIFLPYYDSTYLNNCEVASYIHLAPFFIMISPLLFYRLYRHDDTNLYLGIVLTCILILEAYYMLFGIPTSLAQLTFLKYCNRMGSIYDWTASVFTVWGASSLLKYKDILTTKEKIFFPLLYGIVSYNMCDENTYAYFKQIGIHGIHNHIVMITLCIIACVILLYLLCFRKMYIVSLITIIVMLFAGGSVNPVELGVGAITNHPLSRMIQDISQNESDALWLKVGLGPLCLNNFICANGGKCLNATNFYPDIEKWQIIDSDGIYDDLTNRYLNQYILITDEQNRIDLTRPDAAVIYINADTLKMLGIDYILTDQDSIASLDDSIEYEKISEQDGLMILKLSYA